MPAMSINGTAAVSASVVRATTCCISVMNRF
jgi:hypothetical protein